MDNFFFLFTVISLIFAVESGFINIFHPYSYNWSMLISVPSMTVLMFFSSYSIRRTVTKMFFMQTEAEKTRDSLTQILDNLPDAVIMLESNDL